MHERFAVTPDRPHFIESTSPNHLFPPRCNQTTPRPLTPTGQAQSRTTRATRTIAPRGSAVCGNATSLPPSRRQCGGRIAQILCMAQVPTVTPGCEQRPPPPSPVLSALDPRFQSIPSTLIRGFILQPRPATSSRSSQTLRLDCDATNPGLTLRGRLTIREPFRFRLHAPRPSRGEADVAASRELRGRPSEPEPFGVTVRQSDRAMVDTHAQQCCAVSLGKLTTQHVTAGSRALVSYCGIVGHESGRRRRSLFLSTVSCADTV